jgi:hypothetical protein
MKHRRPILLEPWQQEIATAHPDRLLRGLIHSDGWRGQNKVVRHLPSGTRRYSYPRYQFSNRSDDIRAIFSRGCEDFGIEWKRMNRYTISVARRDDVAKLDLVIGPKS